jgi:hypothetical protein
MDSAKTDYTQDEVNEILKRALAEEAGRERILSHAELVDIATEVGIERDALDRAMAGLAQEQLRAVAARGEAAEIAAERRVQGKRFAANLLSHGLLNGLFYFICAKLTGGQWYVWTLVGSGVLLTLQLRHVVFPYDKVQRRRRQTERQRERERKRAERDQWKARIFGGKTNAADAAKGFETVVQAGVSALLAIAERKLAEHREREARERRDRRS